MNRWNWLECKYLELPLTRGQDLGALQLLPLLPSCCTGSLRQTEPGQSHSLWFQMNDSRVNKSRHSKERAGGENTEGALYDPNDHWDESEEGKLTQYRQMEMHFRRHWLRKRGPGKLRRLIQKQWYFIAQEPIAAYTVTAFVLSYFIPSHSHFCLSHLW